MKAEHRAKHKAVCRNPQHSQERILEAALREFADKGFAGARVDAIARRARINKRMLYHYFGDKEGLFREVLRRKMEQRAAWLASAPENPTESLPYWFELACRDPEWVRLLEWEALQWGEQQVIDEELRRESARSAIERLRRREAKGLISAEYDPGQLLLSIMALTAYPHAFPQLARLVTGLSVSDPRFQEQREEFLRRFASAFQPRRGDGSAGDGSDSPGDEKEISR
jgi:AcrR family transcriptional regulator